jgi:hypothetical protein
MWTSGEDLLRASPAQFLISVPVGTHERIFIRSNTRTCFELGPLLGPLWATRMPCSFGFADGQSGKFLLAFASSHSWLRTYRDPWSCFSVSRLLAIAIWCRSVFLCIGRVSCWSSSAQSFWVLSPTGLMTMYYFLTTLGVVQLFSFVWPVQKIAAGLRQHGESSLKSHGANDHIWMSVGSGSLQTTQHQSRGRTDKKTPSWCAYQQDISFITAEAWSLCKWRKLSSSYFTENTLCLHYKDQSANAVRETAVPQRTPCKIQMFLTVQQVVHIVTTVF